MPDANLVALARQTALANGLNDTLVCAIVERESNWNPQATRYEDAFYKKYVLPLNLTDPIEAKNRATSFGLMQTMLESVREIGYKLDANQLYSPSINLIWGCLLFRRKLAHANGDMYTALQLWNGGSNPNYASEVINRMPHYVLPAPTMDAGDL